MTVVLETDALNPDIRVIEEGARILLRGGLVAFPTETVYGLGAVAFFEKSVSKVFEVKKRPPDNPLIIHISSMEMLEKVAVKIPEDAFKLAERLWPGPLTLVLPRHPSVPKITTGGLDTVAVRMPAHPVALKLIELTGYPIAAPSANLSGRPSPTTAEHVLRDLEGRIDAIIDAGETFLGVESTVLNILEDPPVLLRPGAFPVEDIERILGKKIHIPVFARGYTQAEIALAPGMKYRHYAPEAPLILVEATEESPELIARKVISALRSHAPASSDICIIASSETRCFYEQLEGVREVFTIGSRRNLYEVARNLFKILRSTDEAGCRVVVVEGFPETGIGLAVMNRLRKASSLIIR